MLKDLMNLCFILNKTILLAFFPLINDKNMAMLIENKTVAVWEVLSHHLSHIVILVD